MEFDLHALTDKEQRLLGFAEEYVALCEKYDIEIGACGCCESPYLVNRIDQDAITSIEDIDAVRARSIVDKVKHFITVNHNKL